MIIRVWGEVDGVEIPLRPLKDKPDYWYGYCDWSPNLLHMELWAENDRGVRGHFDGFVKIQYIGNAKTVWSKPKTETTHDDAPMYGAASSTRNDDDFPF